MHAEMHAIYSATGQLSPAFSTQLQQRVQRVSSDSRGGGQPPSQRQQQRNCGSASKLLGSTGFAAIPVSRFEPGVKPDAAAKPSVKPASTRVPPGTVPVPRTPASATASEHLCRSAGGAEAQGREEEAEEFYVVEPFPSVLV